MLGKASAIKGLIIAAAVMLVLVFPAYSQGFGNRKGAIDPSRRKVSGSR
jgi:hypothetical protein